MSQFKIVKTKSGLFYREDNKSLFYCFYDAIVNSRELKSMFVIEDNQKDMTWHVREYRDENNSVCRDVIEIFD